MEEITSISNLIYLYYIGKNIDYVLKTYGPFDVTVDRCFRPILDRVSTDALHFSCQALENPSLLFPFFFVLEFLIILYN